VVLARSAVRYGRASVSAGTVPKAHPMSSDHHTHEENSDELDTMFEVARW
jgi:hypothetical protein